ncbi:CDP-diacylglycerol--glycerol-3-phosphate 3-phosphatidyltransferase, mitochondrial isoform X3 [Ailuropoda melanoleuca]|uniref:CDP-diacylglycerol--glycerol-3-phosphate 3-phosphatidyltransferase, mitochondrial isoform X3 n=1 Tax=Ailuropoda melanoleuca TaxID=9646 RepID=UPI0014943FA2|nr:CDP-diacylglycerol--glycerol-3-phosphate 3-phosphatidyltransferase, mitochondrial isoform X3 [Ailuropoda melanoleuca]
MSPAAGGLGCSGHPPPRLTLAPGSHQRLLQAGLVGRPGVDRAWFLSPWLLLAPLLSPAVPQVTSPPCCLCPEGVHRFQWIRNLVPEFGVSSSHVRVLSSPAEFFELMKGQINVAKRRVVMASLYLGTGPLEQELVDCLESTLEKSLQAKFPSDLKVSILLDFTRGSRGRKNSRTMLLPLLQRFPEQVRVSLFHTPNLRGLLRLLIPERFNETIGLQHIKVYLFDNNVILSGANLSDSYFTNRQDRYVFLQDCAEIADFFTELVDAVGDVSLQLQGDDTVHVVEGMVHPYKGDRAAYCRAANKRVMDVINSARARQQVLHAQTFHGDSLLTQEDAAAAGDRRPAPDTWIYPLIQMKPFEIQIDEIVTESLLTEAERGARVYLTTGYFNLTQAYMDLVLGTRAEYQILLASPEVNGFFGAKGVAGAIPAAYVHIERQFYRAVCSLGQQERVQLQEYWRRGWTFHAKGLWLYLAGSSLPCLTLIGSPNFGYRSVHRDLEAQIAIVTESRALQQQLHQWQREPGSSQACWWPEGQSREARQGAALRSRVPPGPPAAAAAPAPRPRELRLCGRERASLTRTPQPLGRSKRSPERRSWGLRGSLTRSGWLSPLGCADRQAQVAGPGPTCSPWKTQEQERLYLRSGAVSSATFEQPSRQVKLWVKLVTPLIKNFF